MAKGKRVKKVAQVLAIAAIALFGTSLIGKNKTKDYSSVDDVYKIAEALDSETITITNNEFKDPVRLKHNGNDPIYISISDKFSEEQLDCIEWSLDYVFDVVGSINSNYKYEIVDNSDAIKESLKGKTTIFYNLGSTIPTPGGVPTQGQIFRPDEVTSIVAGCPLRTKAIITYDKNNNKDASEGNMKYTFMHELLHAFGLDDVYVTKDMYRIDRHCANTIMNSGWDEYLQYIMPNDYKNLIAMYAPKMTDEKMADFIIEQKQKVNRYEKEFYKFYSDLSQDKTQIDSTLDTSKNYHFNYTRKLFTEQNTEIIENLDVVIQNGKYVITITDKDNNIVDQVKGDVIDCGNSIVLKDVDFKTNIRPLTDTHQFKNGYITDLVVMQDKENQKYLYEFFTNDLINVNEKIQEQDLHK